MYGLDHVNVNDAYSRGMRHLAVSGKTQNSRAGEVVALPYPLLQSYSRPDQRVLFSEKRDANPFFHVAEALWMLAGWNDARVLDRFVSDFSERYAEDDGLAHGAYGARWRKHFTHPEYTGDENNAGAPYWLDQITEAGRLLRNNPESRQVVIGMWDPAVDLGAKKRDIPCNDLIMFRAIDGKLDMTIVARSHDAIWGAYGANFVHMTVMHEVVAALAGLKMGMYYHLSNNFHYYTAVSNRLPLVSDRHDDVYSGSTLVTQPIARSREEAEDVLEDAERYCRLLQKHVPGDSYMLSDFKTQWVMGTALKMLDAHSLFKMGEYDAALSVCDSIASTDWGYACRRWIERRIEKKAAK